MPDLSCRRPHPELTREDGSRHASSWTGFSQLTHHLGVRRRQQSDTVSWVEEPTTVEHLPGGGDDALGRKADLS